MVHLELTNDMSTSEFLQVFNRMIGRRGLCETMWSDNAPTFKSAEREIRKLYWSGTKFEAFMESHQLGRNYGSTSNQGNKVEFNY